MRPQFTRGQSRTAIASTWIRKPTPSVPRRARVSSRSLATEWRPAVATTNLKRTVSSVSAPLLAVLLSVCSGETRRTRSDPPLRGAEFAGV